MKKFCVLFLIIISTSFCKSKGVGHNKDEMFNEMLVSKELSDFYKLCERPEKDINIYDATNQFENYTKLLSQCDKTINVVKANFKIEVNNPTEEKESKIVLYDFRKDKTNTSFYFIDTQTNATLIITYNNISLELVTIERGAF